MHRVTLSRTLAIALLAGIALATPPAPAAHTAPPEVSAAPGLFWFAPHLPARYDSPRVTGIAFDPSRPRFALASLGAGDDHLLRTIDGGRTWATTPGWQPQDNRFGHQIVSGGRAGVFYMVSPMRLYRSNDYGATWESLPYNLALCNQIQAFAVHPAEPDTLFAGTTNGVVRSADGGATWELAGESCLGGPIATTLAAGLDQPDVLYMGRFSNDGGGVMRSPDRGTTWVLASNGLPKTSWSSSLESIVELIVDRRDANVVYALTEAGGVYATSTGGQSWARLLLGAEGQELRRLAYDAGTSTLYATSDQHIYRLDAGERRWRRLNAHPLPQVASALRPHGLAVDPLDPSRLLAFNDNGIYVGLPEQSRVLLPVIVRAE